MPVAAVTVTILPGCPMPLLNLSSSYNTSEMLHVAYDTIVALRHYLGAVDVKETNKTFIFVVDAPGMTKDDINVQLAHGVLTLSGQVREPAGISGSSAHWQITCLKCLPVHC